MTADLHADKIWMRMCRDVLMPRQVDDGPLVLFILPPF